MAKEQRGSARTPNRPASDVASGKPGGAPGKSGGSSGGAWQPNRVSASRKAGGPNRTLIATAAAVLIGLAIVAFVAAQQLGGARGTSAGDPLITPGAANTTPTSIPSSGRTLGEPNAPVTIDLYGDFRCSACYQFTVGGTAAQVNNQLVATGKARVVWHDFLVIDLHDRATASRDAANAAWCAADQGKFWTMHDWLFANQSITEDASAFTIDRLLRIGQAAGMDMAAFEPCVRNGTHLAEIAAEQQTIPAAATGTPSVFVAGTLVPTSFDAIKAAVDAAAGSAPVPSAAPS